MSYKTPRLLAEAIHKEMDNLKKLLMQEIPSDPALARSQDTWIDLRKLFDELQAMASRPSIDDVLNLAPGEYVAAMKPLVANYHRQLMTANLLAPALCEDLQALAVVMVLIGEGNTLVRTAHVPDREDVALAVETLLSTLDSGTKQVVDGGAEVAAEQLNLAPPPESEPEK